MSEARYGRDAETLGGSDWDKPINGRTPNALKRPSNRPNIFWAERHPILADTASGLARQAGQAVGMVRGGLHAAEGLVGGGLFMGRLADPFDRWLSPPGESALDQLGASVGRIYDYGKQGVADPSGVARDVRAVAGRVRRDLDPTATPKAPTLPGELRRNFDIGANQGELALDIGSLAVGGQLAKGVGALAEARQASTAAKYIAQGFEPGVAEYLAEPYQGMGHHFVPRASKLLGPEASESVFNVLKPKGMSRGDFYELHYKVDPNSYGARLPPRLSRKGWSGKRLGLEKYGIAGRLWHGSPGPLKARVGGGAIGAGALVDEAQEDEQ